jgi:hypothetical protein
MAITLVTIDKLSIQTKNLIRAFVSWSTGSGTALDYAATSNIRLRGYYSNVSAFAAECDVIVADDNYALLDSDLRADTETIQTATAGAMSAIASLISPDDHFAALDSGRRTAIVDEVVADGIATDWTGIPDDLKPQILQHDLIDGTAVAAIIAALTIA